MEKGFIVAMLGGIFGVLLAQTSAIVSLLEQILKAVK